VTGEPRVLDRRTLDELSQSVGGDQEFFAELIDEFLEDAPRQLAALRDGTSSGDADAARRAAHSLKSTGRTFGAITFSTLCQEAEAAAAGGDLGAVGASLAIIGDEFERVMSELAAIRDAV
jgi:histidine phosphotransfer protein HptB